MVAEITPGLPKGRTAIRIISQRVAPNARAASRCARGTWTKTSRDSAEMVGRIMIASTTEAMKMLLV